MVTEDNFKNFFEDQIQVRVNSITTLSIRELYCLLLLNNKIYNDENNIDTLRKKYYSTYSNININQISKANYYMLLIIAYNLDTDYRNIFINEKELLSNLETIMDVYYYVECCKVMDIEIDKYKVRKMLIDLENEGGYYISTEQKENTLFTIYLGYELSKEFN